MKHLILFLFAASLWGQTSGVTTSGNIRSGSGSPESAVSAPVGTVYQRTDGGSGTSLYIKETGSGNTGWVAVASSGATSSSSLTDLKVTKTSSAVIAIAAGTYRIGNATYTYSAGTCTIGSLAISGVSQSGGDIVVTVPSTTGMSNGDLVDIAGVGGATGANGTGKVITVNSSTQFQFTGTAGGTYTSGGTVAGTGTGTAWIFGRTDGYVGVQHPAGAGLLLSCTSTTVVNQVSSPAAPAGSVPLGSVTIVSGAWDTVTDKRAFMSTTSLTQGDGVALTSSGGQTEVAVDSTVARIGGTNTFTGANRFAAASQTAPHRTGSGAPTGQNCTIGDTYFQTDASAGSNTWGCTSTGTPGTWTLQGGGSVVGYGLTLVTTSSTSPLANRTYYVGQNVGQGLAYTSDTSYVEAAKLVVPKAGTVKAIAVTANWASGVKASNENVTFSLCVNGTSGAAGTCTTLGTDTWDDDYATFTSFTGLSIAVSAGDRLLLRVVTPNPWTTTPTNMFVAGTVYVE